MMRRNMATNLNLTASENGGDVGVVTQIPQSFMRRDQALGIPTARSVGHQGPPRDHHFEKPEQLLRDLEIPLIARTMECDEDLIGQPASVAWRRGWNHVSIEVVIVLAHRHPTRSRHRPGAVNGGTKRITA
jgi:hypothetical protein